MEPIVYHPHDIEWTPEKVANIWGYYSNHLDKEDAYFSRHSGMRILDYIQSYIPLAGKLVLDFGCGRGDMLKYLVAKSVECQGLEFSKASIAVALNNVGTSPYFRGVVYADSVPSTLPEAGFDVVILIEVVEHLFNDQLLPTFKEAHRLLRPGGFLVVTCPHAEDLSHYFVHIHCPDCGSTFHRWQHMRSVTPESLTNLINEVGFQTISCRPVDFSASRSLFFRLVNRLRFGYRRLRGKTMAQKLPHLAYIGRK